MGQGHQYRRREGRAVRGSTNVKRIAAVILGLAVSTIANAQPWPSKTIRYIVPFPPGAFNDTLARTLANELPNALGQPVIGHHRPGGNAPPATQLEAKTPPDGYTRYSAAPPFSVIQSL